MCSYTLVPIYLPVCLALLSCLKCAFVSGIMTLTRTPCELDKMSLFQDLKLKRRKVDSRCSSDGKSLNILNGLAAFNLG